MKNTKVVHAMAIIISIILIMLMMPIFSDAAAFSASASSSSVTEGESFTVAINASGLTGRFDISVDNGTANISKVWVENGKPEETIKVTTKGSGTTTVTIKAVDVTDSSRNDVTGSTSCKVTVKAKNSGQNNGGGSQNNGGGSQSNEDDKIPSETQKPTTTTKSSNNALKSLKVNQGTLSPEFNARTYDYTVDVGNDVESIKITASAEDSKATISGTGTKKLKEGSNVFNVNVKAENGTEKTYKITVNRKETTESDLKLETFELKQITLDGEYEPIVLSPEFKPDVYEYTCEVGEDITSLDVSAIAVKDEYIVEIYGNENLQVGENEVIILVRSSDGEKNARYTIKVTRKAPEIMPISAPLVTNGPQMKQEGFTMQQILISVFTAIIAIMGVIYAVIEYRYKREDEIEDDENVTYDEDKIGEIPFARIDFQKEDETENQEETKEAPKEKKENSGETFGKLGEFSEESEEGKKPRNRGKHF